MTCESAYTCSHHLPEPLLNALKDALWKVGRHLIHRPDTVRIVGVRT